MNSGRAWTTEELERLRALLAERELDYTGIAVAMGRSKDAIIGKVHRLKLPSPPSFYDPARRGPRGQWLSPVQRVSPGRKLPAVEGPAPPPAAPAYAPPVAAIPPARVCQYPTSADKPWRFCEAPVAAGRPYCPQHLAACYIRHRLQVA